MKSISLRYFVDWKEYYRAERFLLRQQHWVLPEQFSGALLLLLAIFFRYFDFPLGYSILPLIAGILFLCVPVFRHLGLRKRWEREPILQAEHIVSYAQDGIHYLLNGIESNLDWKYYQRWIESPQGFLLVYGQDVFNLIPKSAFDSPATINNFRQLIAGKLGNQ